MRSPRALAALLVLLAVLGPACSSSTDPGCEAPTSRRAVRAVLDPDTGDLVSRTATPFPAARREVERRSATTSTTTPYGDIDVSLASDRQLRGIRRSGTKLWNTRLDHRLVVDHVVPLLRWLVVAGTVVGGPEGDDRDVAALVDPATGRLLWTRPLPWPPRALGATPDEHLVVAVLHGTFGQTVVVGLDPPTGAVAWAHALDLPDQVVLDVTDDAVRLTASDPVLGCA